ncbi:F-box/LRR-repeat protein 18-like isoform X2 [Saccoglossus kowalevskii]
MFPITILGLSDELLLAVLSFLSVKDILSVADVNKRLHDVASDLSLSRKGVNFSRCYEVTNDDVKSFFQLQSPKAVRVLNFNQCYWFKSKFIQNVLRKCNNVTEIDLRGCQVTAVLLSDILEKTKKLQTLGWSTEGNFNESKPCAETLKKLRKLWLSVHYCCRSLLGLCLNLELLHLDSTSETKCECRQSQRVHHYPNLKELIMFTRNVPCLPLLSSKQLTQMRRIAVPDDIYGHYFQYKSQSLQTLDVDVMRSVSNIRMGTPALRIFKELKWEHNGGVLLASLIEKCHNLEYLNITCHCHLRRDQQIIIQEVADNIANNEKVTALSLPVCLLGSVHSEEKSLNKPRFTFNGVIRSTRVGMSTSCEAEPNKLLSNILKCCADLKEFSLISPSFVSELNGQRPVLW